MIKGKDILDIIHELNVLRNPVAWHTIGDTDEPAFQNSWVNHSAPFNYASYRKLHGGRIELRGLVKSGAVGNAIFTLPLGYRPLKQYVFDVISANTQGRVDIFANGDTVAVAPSINSYVSLDGIIFSIT